MKAIGKLPDPMPFCKSEIVDILLKEEYGYLPSHPYSVTAIVENTDAKFCAGKADLQKIMLTCHAEWGAFSFPVYYAAPKGKNIPCFIHINFRDSIPDRYQPTEELIDAGFATLTFNYEDVTSDDGDFTNGLAGIVYPGGRRRADQCGKIGLWAWAAMAVMDYAQSVPEIDKNEICVVGHSRLGKTALLAGALDERFYCAFSNDSGCSGASLARKNTGETIKNIVNVFPYWFCENYDKYGDHVDALPFDQHWLIAANLPHKVYVASAAGDDWACPENEYLACIAADEYYTAHGHRGFVHPDRLPDAGECLHGGDIGYHLRAGTHYLSREDWLYYIKFLQSGR